jgi:hypothetical protein
MPRARYLPNLGLTKDRSPTSSAPSQPGALIVYAIKETVFFTRTGSAWAVMHFSENTAGSFATFHTAQRLTAASNMEVTMRRRILVLGSVFLFALSGPLFAAGPGAGGHGTGTGTGSGASANTGTPRALGQPNQSCGSDSAPETPGDAFFAPGSAFNPFGIAGMMYAGQQAQNSNNPAAVSQYDVACANQR